MDSKTGGILYNGKKWFSVPAVIGLTSAPDDLMDHPRINADARLGGTIFAPQFFNGDPSNMPKGQLLFYPGEALRDFMLELRRGTIAEFCKSGAQLGKKHHKKEYEKCSTEDEKIAYVTALADKVDLPEFHFPMRVDTSLSTATETVYKITAKHNIFKPAEGERSEPLPHWFSEDVVTWLEQHPNDVVNTPDPVDLHGDPLPWSTIRDQKPGKVPVNFTGIITDFCISAQPINKEAGGKIFYNTAWASTLQIASYEKGSDSSAGTSDNSRFFANDADAAE